MKIFFGYKIEKGKAYITDSSCFVKRSISDEQRKSIEDSIDRIEDAKKNSIPKIAPFIALISSLPTVLGLLALEFSNMSIADTFELYPAVSWGVLVSLIIFWGSIVYVFLKSKQIKKSDEYLRLKAAKQRVQEQCYEAMGVPDTAEGIDVFFAQYEQKNTDIKIVGVANILNYKSYIENNELCLANEIAVLGIPLESLKNIVKIKKRMSFKKWEREEHYRKLGVKKGTYEYYVSSFYALKLEYNGEEYAIYFPPYELETIEKLTGLKAE